MPISGNRNRPDSQLPVHSLRGDRRGLGAPSAAYFGQGIGVRLFLGLVGTWFSGVVVSTLMRGEKQSFRMSAFSVWSGGLSGESASSFKEPIFEFCGEVAGRF
jgi:hypothetical protein